MIVFNIKYPNRVLKLKENDHNATVVKFIGYEKQYDDTSVYFQPDSDNCDHSILLDSELKFTVQVDITETVGEFTGTLWEVKKDADTDEWVVMHPSDPFKYEIVESNLLVAEGEASDPELELIYEQMNQQYLTIKNAYEGGELKGEKGEKGDTGEQGPQCGYQK